MDTIPPLSLPILLDGATGSELYKRGMPAGAYTEQWVLGHPEALLELQRGYVAAGSQVLIAPTFGANRVRLEQHGIFGQVADYNRRLVELSRQAAGGRALVAGDMAPTGLFIAPFGESSFEELVAIYTEQAAALAAAGVDLFLIETTMTMPEARAAVLACKSVSDRPVWVTFTCDENGRTLSGTDVLAALIGHAGHGSGRLRAELLLRPGGDAGADAPPHPLHHRPAHCQAQRGPARDGGGAGGVPLPAGGVRFLRRRLRGGRRSYLWRLLRHYGGACGRPARRGGGGGFLRLWSRPGGTPM